MSKKDEKFYRDLHLHMQAEAECHPLRHEARVITPKEKAALILAVDSTRYWAASARRSRNHERADELFEAIETIMNLVATAEVKEGEHQSS